MTDLFLGLPAGLGAVVLLGLAAGLAVAVPLGPVGLLIIERSAARGRRHGYAAAAGVASVDLFYAAAAVTGSAWVAAAVEPWRRPASLIAAAILAGLGLVALLVPARDRPDEGLQSDAAPPERRLVATYFSFVGLTALNPATVTYFAALAVGLSDHLGTWGFRLAFVVAAASASLGWQALLVVLGRVLAARAGRFRRLTRRVGGAMLLLYAILLV